jgi:transcription antitermination factor NusG
LSKPKVLTPVQRAAMAAARGLARIADWLLVSRLEIDLPWCVIISRQGRETSVQAELAMAGWSTFLPMQTMWAGRGKASGRRRNVPLFSRYVFAACNPGGDLAAPSGMDDVQAVRRSAAGGSVVAKALLARLMIAEASHGFDLTYEKPRPEKRALACGQAVTVRAGVLQGFDGLIVKVLSERAVIARVTVFEATGELEFRAADLEPVEDWRPAA